MIDQAQKLRQMAVSENTGIKRPKIFTIASGKGGVGKSNFTVNLSIALQKMGKKVMIFDADVGMGNDDVLMGFLPKYNVFDIIYNKKNIEEVIVTGPLGIKLLPGGTGLSREINITDEQKTGFIDKLANLGELDYIFIDTGAGINRTVLGFIACGEELIIVTTPEPTSITDSYSLLKAVKHFKLKETAKIVVNRIIDKEDGEMTYSRFNNAVSKFLKMDIQYLGKISEDKRLIQSVRLQQPVILNYPSCEASRDINNIAKKLVGETDVSNGIEVKSFFKRIFSIFS